MSVLAQTQPRNEGAFGSSRHGGILLSQDTKGWELCYQFISDWGCWFYLPPVLEAHEEPNTWSLHRSFYKTLPTRLFWEYQPCCLLLGIPVWQEGLWSAAGCQRHSGTADTQSKCPLSCSSSTEIIQTGHSSHRTSLTKGALVKKQLLSLLSPKHRLWHDWTAPSTPSNIPAALPEVAGSGPRPQQAAGALPASPESAGAGTCSKLGARLQWHLTNDPMPGAPLLFPGRYPDWQGARNLKNRCLGLLCCCVFNGSGQERDEKAGPEAGLQPCCAPQGQRTKGAPGPAGHGRGKLGHTLRTAVETLQHQHGSYQLSENTGLLSSLLNEKTIKRQLNTK